MGVSRKQGEGGSARPTGQVTTTRRQGELAEAWARRHLEGQGLVWVAGNFRTPGRGGGEIDLIMREPDGTLVFVEVRQRSRADFGGAGASVSAAKQRRIVFAARHYLMRLPTNPPCRFDVLLIDGSLQGLAPPTLTWLRAAFDAG
jgi:putative endonuclease